MPRTFTGSYSTTQTLSNPATDNPATVTSTGTIDVNSTVSNAVALYGGNGFAWTITNLGTVESVGSLGDGVILASGGLITNGASSATAALIAGYDAVRLYGAPGTLVNYGTINSIGSGFGAQGVDLLAGGTVQNYGVILGLGAGASGINAGFATDTIINGAASSTGALIEGYLSGVDQFDHVGTVLNFGTIESTNADGVYLQAGGSVTNYGSGLITGGGGVRIAGAAGSLTNYGTIAGTSPGSGGRGIDLGDGGALINAGLIEATGALGVLVAGATGTVVNSGTILSNVSDGYYYVGLFLDAGGRVTNQSSGLIEGNPGAVTISGGAGTLVNHGTIESTGTSSTGVYMTAGGSITNAGTGLISASADAVVIAGSLGTVVNSGTVEGPNLGVWLKAGGRVTNSGTVAATSGDGVTFGYAGAGVGTLVNTGTITANNLGVWLTGGGTVTNGPSGATTASIAGGSNGIKISGTTGTVVNHGTVTATGTFGASVYLADGGRVTNGASGGTSALIVGNSNAVAIFFAPGSVTNFATIESIGSAGYGVILSDGGTVTNSGTILETGTSGAGVRLGASGSVANSSTAALIEGRTGVYINGTAGSVTNSGTIIGTGTAFSIAGVYLVGGGSVKNLGPASLIRGGSEGVYVSGGAGTVTNAGTIIGVNDRGVGFYDGGTVTNSGTVIGGADKGVAIYGAVGTVKNSGTIIGANDEGVALYLGGLVSNSGNIIGSNDKGVAIDGAIGTVSNSGTITGGNDKGVALYQGGTVTNSGTITGSDDKGVAIYGAIGTVKNTGTIIGTYQTGVALHMGGSVINSAGLIGGDSGVYIGGGTGTVTNFGTVRGTGTGGIGVDLVAGGTVTDFGRINGASGTAISFGGTSANRLILEPGYHLSGKVIGSPSAGATNTLELGSAASAGTLSVGPGNKFVNFGTVTVDVGARWTLTGANSLAGITLTDFGTLTNTGSLGGGSIIVDPASLINSGSIGTTVTLAGGSYLHNKAGGTIALAGTAVVGIGGAATVVNAGRIIGNGTTSDGIYLAAGGRVSNTTATARIAGGDTGVLVSGTVGTVTNNGTITSNGTSGAGVSLFAGRVTNGATNATGAVISASHFGVHIQNSAGTVVNFGSITSSADTGIWLHAGTVLNGPSGATHALISGPFDGVFVAVGRGTVVNYGTMTGGGSNDGVCLNAGGRVSNGLSGATAALISGYAWGVEVQHSAGTVLNFGTVESTGTSGSTSGVLLKAGGTVVDAGTIRGASGIAISFRGTTANRLILAPGYHLGGRVIGSASAGAANTLELAPGAATGTVSSVIAAEFIQFGAVKVDGGANWVLASDNTIAAGHTLTVNGTLTDLGTLTNAGVINGSGQLIVDPATLVNSGSIRTTVTLAGGGYLGNKTPGRITAAVDGVFGTGGAATVVNQGQITGTAGTGVRLLTGGRVSNQSSGSITGGDGGVYILGGVGTLSNSGTIVSSTAYRDGIYLNAGGIVSNSGLVSGLDGVDLRSAGTVTNSGKIIGGGSGNVAGVFLGFNYSAGAFRVNNTGRIISSASGVLMDGAGTITNGSSAATDATIRGSIGVQVAGAGVATVTNFGTITGTSGTAVSLGTGNDLVVIEKGSVLNGAVAGFHIGDIFDLPFMSFSSAGTVTLGANNVLRVAENGGTFNIKLDPSQNFTGDFFHIAGDGGGGTLVTENHSSPAPYSISPNPAKVLDNAGHLTFTITRTDTSGPAVVYASVEQDQGFANNGDYIFVNDTEVNFAAGVASVKVSVGIIDTGAASGSEVFRFIIQQHRTDPVSTSLASDKFTITNTSAPAAAARTDQTTSVFTLLRNTDGLTVVTDPQVAAGAPGMTFDDIALARPHSGAANSGNLPSYLTGARAANEQTFAGGHLLFATGHPGGSLLSLAGGANHHSLLPASR